MVKCSLIIFYFVLILDVEKSCENSYVPFTHIPQMLQFYLICYHSPSLPSPSIYIYSTILEEIADIMPIYP